MAAAEIIDFFKSRDKHGLGTVSRSTLANLVRKLKPSYSEDDINVLLRPWGDGLIFYEEFAQWLVGDTKKHMSFEARRGADYKIAVFSAFSYDKESLDRFNLEMQANLESCSKVQLIYHTERLDVGTAQLAAGCNAVCTFVYDFVTGDVVRALHGLGIKAILLRCEGFDRVDLEATQECSIIVACVPAYAPYSIAEHAVALMLAANRKIPMAYRKTREGNFALKGLEGVDMVKKKVGIIGTGLIGSIVAQILKKGFECDVVAYDPGGFINPRVADPEPGGLGIAYVELDELAETSDFITLHCPLNEGEWATTRHIIDAELISRMKHGVTIVNVARGELIDTSALIQGLKVKIIGAAALDVVEGDADYFFQDRSSDVIYDKNLLRLLRFPNVIITPHQSFFTRDAMRTIAETTLASANGIRTGEGPPRRLDLDCVRNPTAAGDKTPDNVCSLRRSTSSRTQSKLMRTLPRRGPVLFEDDFPAIVNNASEPYKVAVFSKAEYDQIWFERMNGRMGTDLIFTYHSSRLEVETAQLAQGCNAVCVFVNDEVNDEVLQLLSSYGIKMVALRCAGFNNVDLEAAEKLGIVVCRVPAYSPHAVAEHAVALLTSVNRRIPQAHEGARQGRFKLDGLIGIDLNRKKVGIVGTGQIGGIAARILKNGFACNVVAYDLHKNSKIQDPPPAGLGIEYVELDEIFRTCDVISLHMPLFPATRHTINIDAVKKMKPGVLIINTSRGGLIDNVALLWGLREGIIGGAGLDVVEGEDKYFFKDYSSDVIEEDDLAALLGCNNVVITAHQAFFTMEAMETISHTTIASINGVRNGLGPPKQKGTLDTLCLPKRP